uniref:Uncharacterized protein n=1 Tax=Avena sativa TaxID=4498 RepID=A0ACD5U3J6_AVESA
MAAGFGSGRGKVGGSTSPRSARFQMEEALGKLDITDEEATPLVLDDREEDGVKHKWSLAGKVLFRNTFHIQTITSALRPAWGNPKGLVFRSVGRNMFVADFKSQRDRDRVKAGSPWHVSHNDVILEEFVDHMRPTELKFDKLQLWDRVINLPFNLMNENWGKAIARQLDKNATSVQIDPVGGYLRARITVDVNKPLRRGMLIESAKRQSTDWYEIQYEQVPYFCFSCGRLGHSDIFCPTPGSTDADGNLPFGPELRADDDRKKTGSAENSSRDRQGSQNGKHATNLSSSVPETGEEVNSPVKKNAQHKRKGVHQQVYRKVEVPTITGNQEGGSGTCKEIVMFPAQATLPASDALEHDPSVNRDPKKKKPTPTTSENSAAAAE